MPAKQKTIKYSVSCTGVGLHTGVQSTVTFHPADENTGIKFIRNDKGDKVVTPDIDNVVDLTRGTTIEENGVRVHTTEHVMSACAGMRVNNLLIELNSKEPPVMDGSSKDFVSALKEGEIIEQNAPVDFLNITKPVVYNDEEKDEQTQEFKTKCVIQMPDIDNLYVYLKKELDLFVVENPSQFNKLTDNCDAVLAKMTKLMSSIITGVTQFDCGISGFFIQIMAQKSRPDVIVMLLKL